MAKYIEIIDNTHGISQLIAFDKIQTMYYDESHDLIIAFIGRETKLSKNCDVVYQQYLKYLTEL